MSHVANFWFLILGDINKIDLGFGQIVRQKKEFKDTISGFSFCFYCLLTFYRQKQLIEKQVTLKQKTKTHTNWMLPCQPPTHLSVEPYQHDSPSGYRNNNRAQHCTTTLHGAVQFRWNQEALLHIWYFNNRRCFFCLFVFYYLYLGQQQTYSLSDCLNTFEEKL